MPSTRGLAAELKISRIPVFNAYEQLLAEGYFETFVLLEPKAFDARLCLVRAAEHLVSKQELRQMLWPDVHVSERNLTNPIVRLGRILGREAIEPFPSTDIGLNCPSRENRGKERDVREVRAGSRPQSSTISGIHARSPRFVLDLPG